MQFPLKTLIAAFAISTATASFAAPTLVSGGACNALTPNPDSTACAGAYAGNLNNNNSIGDLNLAIDALVGSNYPNVTWASLEPTGALVTGNGDDATGTITFQQALLGDVILSVHFGDAGTGLGDRTILYLFNFATPTTTVALNTQGFSNAVYINTPVPEPATWALMIIGFAGVGMTMRYRRRAKLPQLA